MARNRAHARTKAALKRALDVLVAAVTLLVLLPALIVVGLLIKLDSRGPVLFKQKRVGRDGRFFQIAKFRTMKHRDPRSVDPLREKVVTSDTDPRITRIGRYLRRCSVDELPQLYNVLKGEMSLVGPRPIMVEQLAAVPAAYRARFTVRPGVTGLAQVRGRQNLDWMKKLEYDRDYAESWTLYGDFVIMLQTIRALLSSEDVYYREDTKNWRSYVDQDASLTVGVAEPEPVERRNDVR